MTATAAPTASSVLTAVMSQLGVKYTWGGESPGKDFDCSGLTQWAYGTAGIELPRTSEAQYSITAPVSLADAKPGDLVFLGFGDQGQAGPGHVGVYIGAGKYVDAPHTGAVVRIDSVPAGSKYGRVPGLTLDGGDGSNSITAQQASPVGFGCASKGNAFGFLTVKFSFCQAKALIGGLCIGGGVGIALFGVSFVLKGGGGGAGGAVRLASKVLR